VTHTNSNDLPIHLNNPFASGERKPSWLYNEDGSLRMGHVNGRVIPLADLIYADLDAVSAAIMVDLDALPDDMDEHEYYIDITEADEFECECPMCTMQD
jgi:hypothetical protein